jgi:hypothetical protein
VESLLGSLPADGWLAIRMRADMGTATSGHVITFCFSASILQVLACAAEPAHAALARPDLSGQRSQSSQAASRLLAYLVLGQLLACFGAVDIAIALLQEPKLLGDGPPLLLPIHVRSCQKPPCNIYVTYGTL